jgi:hypothetical protein
VQIGGGSAWAGPFCFVHGSGRKDSWNLQLNNRKQQRSRFRKQGGDRASTDKFQRASAALIASTGKFQRFNVFVCGGKLRPCVSERPCVIYAITMQYPLMSAHQHPCVLSDIISKYRMHLNYICSSTEIFIIHARNREHHS